MRIKLTSDRVRDLLDADPLNLPQYTSQLINLANQNSQGTRPRVVGQMSELVQEFDGKTVAEWEKWYLSKYGDRIDTAADRFWPMILKLKDAVHKIDRAMVERWVRDLVLVKTFVGLRFQEAILAGIAAQLGLDYRLAEPDEESRGIDGSIGQTTVSIKPLTYKAMSQLPESSPIRIIYYEKKDNDLLIEFDEHEII
ncbi:MjaI family restriction endonuclease [candidate division KSB1 bacterium]|nr:MjaI family restriction endonuclease [candidate division KSB1 bacterium]